MRMLGSELEKTERMDISRHLGVLRRYALVLTREPERAEDLVQEAALRALEGRHTWRGDDGRGDQGRADHGQDSHGQDGHDLKKWLLAIVHNTHVSRCRRQRSESEATAALAAQSAASQPPNQPDRVTLGETVNALMDLPEDLRAVLTLVAIDGMSYRDAADCLGIPVGTLMSRLGRARAALRAAADRAPAPAPHLRLVR